MKRPRGDQMIRRSSLEEESRDLARVEYEGRAIRLPSLADVCSSRVLERRSRPWKRPRRGGNAWPLAHAAESTPTPENA